MSSIYDRLGDLLSETLSEGKVPIKKDRQKKSLKDGSEHNSSSKNFDEDKKEKDFDSFSKEKISKQNNYGESSKTSSEKKSYDSKNKNHEHKKIIYKKITPELSFAFRLLGITFSASLDDIKKAYKEKLKVFHPDRYDSNPVMKNVATTKTKQVIDAYNLIMTYMTE